LSVVERQHAGAQNRLRPAFPPVPAEAGIHLSVRTEYPLARV
jgi:hypothetical protein